MKRVFSILLLTVVVAGLESTGTGEASSQVTSGHATAPAIPTGPIGPIGGGCPACKGSSDVREDCCP